MQTKVLKPTPESLALAAEILQKGGLVAFPTETVYGLGADATNAEAAKAIFAAKGRPADNPLIVHISNLSMLPEIVSSVPEAAQKLMNAFWPGPLTIIMPKGKKIPYAVTAGLETVAVRFPVHPDAQAMIERCGLPIAAPSANLSGKPSPTTAAHVFEDMDGRIPLILDGGPCQVGLESTVVDATHGHIILLRPGGVTREMLEEALGEEVALGKGVMEPLADGEKALSPGLKHKHYAPKAEVKVVLGPDGRAPLRALPGRPQRTLSGSYRAFGGQYAGGLCTQPLCGVAPCRRNRLHAGLCRGSFAGRRRPCGDEPRRARCGIPCDSTLTEATA